MSIATQITRLQNIKTAIRNALLSKGVSASTHDMADFADDIRSISTGIDISDTTASASDVLAGKYFHTSNGAKTEGTMTNNGSVKQTINPSGSYTIPEGYHDGTGKVTANPNQNSGTYEATTRSEALDMGANNTYRYVKTSGIPNVNDGTYSFPVGSLGTKYDMGVSNSNRYVDATNVYTKGSADGQASAIASLTSLTPSASGAAITSGGTYKATANGYAISSYSNIVPSGDGTRFESGFNRMSIGGYAYSERPESVKQGNGTTTAANANYTVNTGLSTIKGFVLFSDGASYDGLVAYIPNMLGSDNYAFSSIYVTNNSGGMQPIGTDGTARTHTIMAVNGGIVTMKTRGANTLGSYRWVAW